MTATPEQTAESGVSGQAETVYGYCTACHSVEVALNKATGTYDLSYMGESDAYPTGYGCEVCS